MAADTNGPRPPLEQWPLQKLITIVVGAVITASVSFAGKSWSDMTATMSELVKQSATTAVELKSLKEQMSDLRVDLRRVQDGQLPMSLPPGLRR